MELIAINEDEDIRIIKCGVTYFLQEYWVHRWKDIKDTTEEWLASKWILDYYLKVSTDYPTISEIRNEQSEEN